MHTCYIYIHSCNVRNKIMKTSQQETIVIIDILIINNIMRSHKIPMMMISTTIISQKMLVTDLHLPSGYD